MRDLFVQSSLQEHLLLIVTVTVLLFGLLREVVRDLQDVGCEADSSGMRTYSNRPRPRWPNENHRPGAHQAGDLKSRNH